MEDFSEYPDLFKEIINASTNLEESFKKFSGIKDKKEAGIKSFTVWATLHGMVGIFRAMPENPIEESIMYRAADVFNNIDDYLEKVFTSIAKA